MKNFLFILAFLLLAGSSKLEAQPYPSIFGRDSTVWYVLADAFDGGIPYQPPTIIYTIKGDTTVAGINYRKVTAVTTRPTPVINPFWIREDINIGRVWSRYFIGFDTVERVLMDFTLELGDTFYMGPVHSSPRMIVDSVYFDSVNAKHIRFNQMGISPAPHVNLNAEFITGVGNNWGLRYTFCSTINCVMIEIGLICAYKDREQVYKYKDSLFNNDCIYPLGFTDPQKGKNAFQLSPNPVTGTLSVSLPAGVATAFIYNVSGQKMWSLSDSAKTLEVSCAQWPPGLYVLRLQDKSGSVSAQTFLKQ